MFAKLVAVIVVLGLTGSGLLAMRQSRLQAAHELTAARLRLRQHEEKLQRVRAMIAERTSPAELRAAFEAHPELLEGLEPSVDRRGMLPAPTIAPDPEANAARAIERAGGGGA